MQLLIVSPWGVFVANLTTTSMSVSKLMESFERGEIAIPEIQRDVVWDSEQVKELVNSIFQDYPCGSLIMWEPRLRDESLVRQIIRPERLEYYGNRLPRYFLIDGQQRVTTLASVMLQPGFLKRVEPEIEEELTTLYVNLRRFPKDIEAGGDGDSRFPWILLNNVFDGSAKESSDFKEKLSAQQRIDIDRNIQRFRDYQFPVQIIQESDYPTVGRIFSLVNSMGTQLTGAEIHMARIIPFWRGISKEFRSYLRDLRKTGYDFDLTLLMRTITVIECDVPQIKKFADKVSQKKLGKKRMNRLWLESKQSINVVVRTLRKGLFLDKTKFFTSKNALIPLVYYAAKAPRKRLDTKAMMKYFIVSQLGGHYSGAGETVLRRDLRFLSEPGIRPKQGLHDLLDAVVKEAKADYRGLRIKPDDIQGVPSKNVMLLLMYIVSRKRGATDFGLVNPQPLNQISSSELHLHHIFPFDFMMTDPQALLYQRRLALKSREYRDQVNDIANITFLSRKKNEGIGNISPWQYLENETTVENRKAHFISEDRELWKPENFDKFLEQRRESLAQAMNALVRSWG
jgi:hypothetical protein